MSTQMIGRMVHYVSYGSADGRYKSKCRAAVVTETHGGEVNGEAQMGLCVLNPTGVFFDRYVRESDEQTPGTWHWPCPVTTEEPEEGAKT